MIILPNQNPNPKGLLNDYIVFVKIDLCFSYLFYNKNIMATTFEFDNYTVTTSLNERTIYIKLVDTLSYMGYETNVDQSELNLSIDLEASIRIINSCFMREDGYSCRVSINNRVMTLTFNALIGGFLRLNFNIMLSEKLMANDAKLTMSFQRLEQLHQADVKKLTTRIVGLEREITRLTETSEISLFDWSKITCYTMIAPNCLYINPCKINIIELNIGYTNCDFSKIHRFFQLKKMSVYVKGANNWSEASNDTLEELTITANNIIRNCLWLKNFPNLKKLDVKSDATLSNALFSSLQTYEHKLKHISVASASAELTAHCVSRKIKLD